MAPKPPAINLLDSSAGRRALFACLYLSEGAPIGLVWWALPTLLRTQGVGLAAITTLTSLATLPWVLKFLAAPLLDIGIARGLSPRRWILVCQLGMAAALLPLVLLDWSAQFAVVVVAVASHAVFAAAQDVGIDTLAVHVVPRQELGRINGWMQAGMLAGRAGVAAGVTASAAILGEAQYSVLFPVVLIVVPALLLLLGVRDPQIRHTPVRLGPMWSLIASRASIAGLVIALIAGAGFEFFGVAAGPRLVDAGRSSGDLAIFFGLLAPAGLAIGAVAGGIITDRVGTLRGTAGGLAVLSSMLLWVGVGDLGFAANTSHPVWFAAVYFAIGTLTASSYALFMSLSQGDFAATRFSLFMAMTNACEAWAGFVGGSFGTASYGSTLIALTAVGGLAGVPLYLLWRQRPPRGAP